jgi:hypothetical protein
VESAADGAESVQGVEGAHLTSGNADQSDPLAFELIEAH